MTADAIEEFLHRRQMALLVENGGVSPAPSRHIGGADVGFDSRDAKGPNGE